MYIDEHFKDEKNKKNQNVKGHEDPKHMDHKIHEEGG